MTVVVKYLFQFGFFPWNGYITLLRYEGKPFFPPRILGLEKSIHYIKYDLLQLLALFFHRSLLLVSPGPWVGIWGELELLLGLRAEPRGCRVLGRGFPPVLVGVDAAGWGARCVGLGSAGPLTCPSAVLWAVGPGEDDGGEAGEQGRGGEAGGSRVLTISSG